MMTAEIIQTPEGEAYRVTLTNREMNLARQVLIRRNDAIGLGVGLLDDPEYSRIEAADFVRRLALEHIVLTRLIDLFDVALARRAQMEGGRGGSTDEN